MGNNAKSDYVRVEKDSQFFTEVEHIINYIEYTGKIDKDYLLIGLRNTIKNGYNLQKNKVE